MGVTGEKTVVAPCRLVPLRLTRVPYNTSTCCKKSRYGVIMFVNIKHVPRDALAP